MPAMNGTLRVGVVGIGRVALERHVPAIRYAGAEVHAFADIIPGRAGRYAADLHVPHAFDDYLELLELAEIDVVSVCTPPPSHAEVSIAALEAGKHVYLDKPPAMNEAEITRVVATACREGTLLMSGSNSIYHNEIQALKKHIQRGELGEIYYVECLKRARRDIPPGWIRLRRFGGGIGMNTCSHRIDQVLYLLDVPRVLSVTARTYAKFASHPARVDYQPMDLAEGLRPDVPVADAEDTMVALVQFEGGTTFLLRDAYAANVPEEWRCDIYGTRAGAQLRPSYAQPHKPSLMIFGEDADGVVMDTRLAVPSGPPSDMAQAYQHFFECVREGKETQSPGERSIVLMRILDAIYRSEAEGGRQVRLA